MTEQHPEEPRVRLAWLIWCYQQGYGNPADRDGLDNWMTDDPATLTDNDVKTQRNLLGMADEILALLEDSACADDGHVHHWVILAVQPHNPWVPIGKPVPHTIVLVRCTECGQPDSVMLLGEWTLDDLRSQEAPGECP